MFARRITAAILAVLLVASGVGATATSGTQQQAYAGSHVTFDTTSNAVVDYTVEDTTLLESVKVQSQSKAKSNSGVSLDGDLSAVTGFAGSAISVDAKTSTQATITTESGATMQAHDNGHGILVVESGSERQFVTANLSESSSAKAAGDNRVVVTTEDGTKGTFIVVGDGDVTVNEAGNVTASLSENSKLVFRSYPEERSESDEKQEQMIADGTAAAEVYVMQEAESNGETVVDVVQYGEDTSVEVTEKTKGKLTMTAERSSSEGRVIITSVSESVIESTENVQVTVDGKAAAKASSYSELRSATNGGETSKFLVHQQSSAEANAEVLVGVNHFSTRTIAMQSGENASGDTGADSENEGDGGTSGVGAPGFGVGVSLVALLSVALLARFRD